MIRISDAELEVMKIIWKEKEVTSLDIIKMLEHCHWNDNTIRTLINRLIAKKAVGISKREGKTYMYVPLIKENEYILKRSRNFVKQFYNGSVRDMVLNFVEAKEISKDDLQFLMDKIDKKKNKGGDL